MTLSAEVPSLIETKLKPLIKHWLQEEGLELGEVGGWAIHPGGTRILAAVQDTLLLSDQQMTTRTMSCSNTETCPRRRCPLSCNNSLK